MNNVNDNPDREELSFGKVVEDAVGLISTKVIEVKNFHISGKWLEINITHNEDDEYKRRLWEWCCKRYMIDQLLDPYESLVGKFIHIDSTDHPIKITDDKNGC